MSPEDLCNEEELPSILAEFMKNRGFPTYIDRNTIFQELTGMRYKRGRCKSTKREELLRKEISMKMTRNLKRIAPVAYVKHRKGTGSNNITYIRADRVVPTPEGQKI